MHIVNFVELLEAGSFTPADVGSVVEAGIAAFPIKGYGRRVLKGALNVKGRGKVDLVLHNVIMVEGFHTNIISKALLLKADIWYHSRDCALRHGPREGSVVRQLQRVGNLMFLKYKPLYTYSSFASQITWTPAGTVRAFPVIRRVPTKEI